MDLPAYSGNPAAFRCIGSACEDTCCQGWNVPIDRDTYLKYQKLPQSPLNVLIGASVRRSQADPPEGVTNDKTAASRDGNYAQIRIAGSDRCPLLTNERLCRVHAELGEEMLSHACSTYPRIVHRFGNFTEAALTLSCPEAARVVLQGPEPLSSGMQNSDAEAAEPPGQTAEAISPDFFVIRQSIFALIRLRSYPMWQRMFLLGLLCRRLDSIEQGELRQSVPQFLADFMAAVGTGSLRPAMATLPEDRTAQLDVVLRLAGLMLHRSAISQRFSASVQAFTAGIGNGPEATLESLSRQYALAHDLSFAPFFQQHPHIFENYLVNTIVRCRFPFGPRATEPGEGLSRTREFGLLTAQFALIRGLLIGVAGFHGAAFSTAHVVSTVQSAAKHFEHHPEFLKLAHELLLESQMDGARGMAILLREARLAPTAKADLHTSDEPQRPLATKTPEALQRLA